jgi:hypothetical protein
MKFKEALNFIQKVHLISWSFFSFELEVQHHFKVFELLILLGQFHFFQEPFFEVQEFKI